MNYLNVSILDERPKNMLYGDEMEKVYDYM